MHGCIKKNMQKRLCGKIVGGLVETETVVGTMYSDGDSYMYTCTCSYH